jgi:hypothetical protein
MNTPTISSFSPYRLDGRSYQNSTFFLQKLHLWRRGEVLVGKPEGKRPLGRPRRRWEDNMKMDLQKVGWWHGLD